MFLIPHRSRTETLFFFYPFMHWADYLVISQTFGKGDAGCLASLVGSGMQLPLWPPSHSTLASSLFATTRVCFFLLAFIFTAPLVRLLVTCAQSTHTKEKTSDVNGICPHGSLSQQSKAFVRKTKQNIEKKKIKDHWKQGFQFVLLIWYDI